MRLVRHKVKNGDLLYLIYACKFQYYFCPRDSSFNNNISFQSYHITSSRNGSYRILAKIISLIQSLVSFTHSCQLCNSCHSGHSLTHITHSLLSLVSLVSLVSLTHSFTHPTTHLPTHISTIHSHLLTNNCKQIIFI